MRHIVAEKEQNQRRPSCLSTNKPRDAMICPGDCRIGRSWRHLLDIVGFGRAHSVRSIVFKNFAKKKKSSCGSAKWETLSVEVLLLGKAEYVFWWGKCKKTTHRVDGVAQCGHIRESTLVSFVHYRILFCASYSVVIIEVLVAEKIIRYKQRPRNI
jgi:hypothetical protein